MHIVQENTQNFLYNFWFIYSADFLDILCLYLYFYQKFTVSPYLRNISPFVAILAVRRVEVNVQQSTPLSWKT